MNNRQKGSCYENIAASFFESKGYVILEKNYRRQTGEIDLIADDHGVLVFAEVKYRARNAKGYPYEAVNAAKMRRIYRTAEWYLKEHRVPQGRPCRFDVVSILGEEVTHIVNAFGGF